MREVIDDAGDTVAIPVSPRRVVSLNPGTTEIIFAIGAGDRLVGRSQWGDYPPSALSVTSVGDAIPPNIEAVLAQQPDLVVLYRSPQNAAAAQRFRSASIPAIQLTSDRLTDVPRLARLLGGILGVIGGADSVAAAFDRDLEAESVSDSVGGNRPSVLLLAWDRPPIAIGSGSFQSELLVRAGAANIFADLSVPSGGVGIEMITARDPDFILINDSIIPGFATRPEWQAVRAVREGRFLLLKNLAFGRPSPRAPQVLRELRMLIGEAIR